MSTRSTDAAPCDTRHHGPIRDELETETSHAQDETVDLCWALLYSKGPKGPGDPGEDHQVQELPRLRREKHIAFLKAAMGTLPSRFVVVDASRPWIFYWALTGLQLLGEDVSAHRER